MQLNKHLQPIGSPVDQKTKINTSVGFNIENKRSAVSASRVKNLTFDQASGGTLTLGGVSNGEGVLRILTPGGGTAVFANNQGIEIFDGNITIANDNGQTILDTSGIVSTAAIPSQANFNGAANVSTTGTTLIDIPGASLNPIILTRNTNVLFTLMAYGLNSNNITSNGSDSMLISLYDSFGSAGITNMFISGNPTTNVVIGTASTTITQSVNNQMLSRTTVISLAAGTHTVKMQYAAVNGGTADLAAWELDSLVLGT